MTKEQQKQQFFEKLEAFSLESGIPVKILAEKLIEHLSK